MSYDNRICRFSWNSKDINTFLTSLNDCRILEYFRIKRINYFWRCNVIVQVSVAIVKNKIVKTNLTLCSFASSYHYSVMSYIIRLLADNSKVNICSCVIIFHKRYRKNKFLSYICEHFNVIFCSQLSKNSIVFIFFLYNKWYAVICIINYCIIQSDKFIISLIKFIFTVIRIIFFCNCQICKICVTLVIRYSYNFQSIYRASFFAAATRKNLVISYLNQDCEIIFTKWCINSLSISTVHSRIIIIYCAICQYLTYLNSNVFVRFCNYIKFINRFTDINMIISVICTVKLLWHYRIRWWCNS